MYKKSALKLFGLLLLISNAGFAQTGAAQFTWGINGHPLTQVAYSQNVDRQLSDLEDLNVKSYRFDVLLDSDGYAKKDQLFIQLLAKLNSRGITALPVLMQSGLKNLSNEAIYKISYTQGSNFAIRYGKYFPVLEVNNEADLKIMSPGNSGGTKLQDYDAEKSQRVIAAIKGFTDGLKKAQPKIKVTLSVSYTHYYYLQLLKDNNVNYDIIGCHWYSNMGPIDNAKPSGIDMLGIIKNKFNKPVWVTEINFSKGTLKADFTTQRKFIASEIPAMVAKGITGIFIYELYDQPALSQRNPAEAHYGLLYKNNITDYAQKDAYQIYKELIQRFR